MLQQCSILPLFCWVLHFVEPLAAAVAPRARLRCFGGAVHQRGATTQPATNPHRPKLLLTEQPRHNHQGDEATTACITKDIPWVA